MLHVGEIEIHPPLHVIHGWGLASGPIHLRPARHAGLHLKAQAVSFWFLPNVAACQAMANLLEEPQNGWWSDYKVIVTAGIGLDALGPVREAISSGFDTKTITLSCGKLTTGVTVPQWSSIMMLRNLRAHLERS